jgi:putative CocE/NonD family hydrolase
MNRGTWEAADEWPPSDTQTLRLYLQSHGHASTRLGDGLLTAEVAEGQQPFDRFTYDPADPVPSEPPGTPLDMLNTGYAERSGIESRPDVLVYTSEPLTEALEVAGPVTLELYVGSNARDTDFAAVLSEVDPQGKSINVTHGMARMRYREGFDEPTSMQPDRVYRLVVDLWHAAIEFPIGHRVRVSISSSHFPAFDRNLNTGGDNYTETVWAVAENLVHHDAAHPSALVLRVRRSVRT